jgi:hypothetical protein
MFAYCGNNPVNKYDSDGNRLVAIGLNIEVTSGSGTGGIDVLIYFDEEVINKSSSKNEDQKYAVVAYSYSGFTVSTDDLLKGNIANVATAVAALYCDQDIEKLNKTNCDEFLIELVGLLSRDFSLSCGVFALFGNEDFKRFSSYSGYFDCYCVTKNWIGSDFSGSFFVSVSNSCTAVGLKGSLSTNLSLLPISVSYSKTYYSDSIQLY